ncbi:hypothetical protein EVAR_93307_1 [Eumeta japonica]|uniref:Uncharacterized protein n=1 Tax=Eumeta variegata TaxID=151549 RepID=A0A4C1UTF6_EUMVA|nr:hypothetical protein EVAR_93307_1 [Eumeta japonica]
MEPLGHFEREDTNTTGPIRGLELRRSLRYGRFRQARVAVSANIKEMFVRVKIRKEDRDSLRFLCIEEAKRVSKQVYKVHRKAAFELYSWASNEIEVLYEMCDTRNDDNVQLGGDTDIEKTFGLQYEINNDTLEFNLGLRNTPTEVLKTSLPPTETTSYECSNVCFRPARSSIARPHHGQMKRLRRSIKNNINLSARVASGAIGRLILNEIELNMYGEIPTYYDAPPARDDPISRAPAEDDIALDTRGRATIKN